MAFLIPGVTELIGEIIYYTNDSKESKPSQSISDLNKVEHSSEIIQATKKNIKFSSEKKYSSEKSILKKQDDDRKQEVVVVEKQFNVNGTFLNHKYFCLYFLIQ